MNQHTALTIKVVITLSLAAAGIGYIMLTPPTSQIADYEKKPLQKASTSIRTESASATESSNTDAADNISLTGKAGRLDEAKIGKSPE